jgi:23S rRNA (guanosine2251-2'-O)-methyltransferase
MMSEQYVYGVHAVSALLSNQLRATKMLYVNQERVDKRIQELLAAAEQQNIRVEYLSAQKMQQRFADFNHQGIVASAGILPQYGESDLGRLLELHEPPYFILILDGVTDPHNLGACLRSADAAGIDFVIIPKDKNASITPVVSKVACGAAESVPLVRVTNLARTLEYLKKQGVWIYGAAGEATSSLYNLDCKGSIALVLGAEDKGMRHLTREQCDGLFSLPMLGTVTSLNVSVATGVCLYEALRQRLT